MGSNILQTALKLVEILSLPSSGITGMFCSVQITLESLNDRHCCSVGGEKCCCCFSRIGI